MSAFIRTIEGKIASVNHAKKELALRIQEVLTGVSQEKTINFSLNQNVWITGISNQPIKLVGLKEGQKVEVGYTGNKAKSTALYIKVKG